VAPAVGLALLWADAPVRRRLQAAALFGLAALVVFAPWPIRNLMQFGEPHFAAAYWRKMNGDPLPASPIAWERTWSSGQEGESYLDLVFVLGVPANVNRPGIILPAMYDSEEEHRRVVALFQRYARESWSPPVVAGFDELARERTSRNPIRTFVTLPLRRIAKLWSGVPEYELPMRVPWLGLPRFRSVFRVYDGILFLAALAGAIGLWRRGPRSAERRLAAMLVACLLGRSLLLGLTAPIVTERYLVEAFPFLIILGAYGAAVWLPSVIRRTGEGTAS
jgi:hypothetical protein